MVSDCSLDLTLANTKVLRYFFFLIALDSLRLDMKYLNVEKNHTQELSLDILTFLCVSMQNL